MGGKLLEFTDKIVIFPHVFPMNVIEVFLPDSFYRFNEENGAGRMEDGSRLMVA